MVCFFAPSPYPLVPVAPKSSHVMDSSSMSVENANEVMKYYDTSLKILKDLVNENEIKAVLGYLDQKMPVDSLPVVSQPVVSISRYSVCF